MLRHVDLTHRPVSHAVGGCEVENGVHPTVSGSQGTVGERSEPSAAEPVDLGRAAPSGAR